MSIPVFPAVEDNGRLGERHLPEHLSGDSLASTFAPHRVRDVKLYGAVGDGVKDDRPAIQAVINSASAGDTVYLPKGTYRVTGQLYPKSGVAIRGDGMNATVLTATAGMQAVFSNLTAAGSPSVQNVTISDLSALGTALDDVTEPRRARTYPHNGIESLAHFKGDLLDSTYPVVANIRIVRCKVAGTKQLPIVLQGIRGEARIQDCYIYNCLDTGFTFCESAIFVGNTVRKSADNGVSVSRGCQRVTIVGNNIDGSCYYGIWVAGFVFGIADSRNSAGPTTFTITGNTVTDSGKGGISCNDAPKWGVISGNVIDGVRRGPADGRNDIDGWGVFIGGFPDDGQVGSLTTPAAYAQGINVVGNTFRGCQRGGVQVRGAKYIDVRSNLFIDFGTEFLSDGTTAVPSSSQSQNIGVWQSDYPGTVTGLTVRENTFVDTRTTAFANFAVVIPAVTLGNHGLNVVYSAQNGKNLLRNGYTDGQQEYYGAQLYNGIIQPVGGLRTGSSTATGNVPGVDLNGAAGSRRRARWMSGTVDRWELAANGDQETGGNSGSNLEIVAKSDAGATISTPLTIRRADGRVSFSAPAKLLASATAGRPPASSMGAGAAMFDTTLGKPIWSDGAVWKDASGTTV